MEIFLQEIARGRGFIAIIDDIMPESGCLSAEKFAISMLLAEGFEEPADEFTFRPELEKLFRERYGPRVSEADFRAW